MCIDASVVHRTRENQGLLLVCASCRSYSVNDCLRPRTGYAQEKTENILFGGHAQLDDDD